LQNNSTQTDVLVIGASASGLMCAIEAGKRGRKVMVLDHASKAGNVTSPTTTSVPRTIFPTTRIFANRP